MPVAEPIIINDSRGVFLWGRFGMENRALVFKFALAISCLSLLLLATGLSAAGPWMAVALIGGCALQMIAVTFFAVSFGLRLDRIGVRSLAAAAVGLLAFAGELLLIWGRSL